MRFTVGVAVALLLTGCAGRIVPPSNDYPAPQHTNTQNASRRPVQLEPPAARPTPSTPLAAKPSTAVAKGPNARSAGLLAGPDLATLPLTGENAARALSAFRASCTVLTRRTDGSGLTQPADWLRACTLANTTAPADARTFFLNNFEAAQIGNGTGLGTGYFIPEINASRTYSTRYSTPIYRKPPDMIELDLGTFADTLKGRHLRGHIVGNSFVSFGDRAAITTGALNRQGLEIAYAEDPVAFFFLQIQGSGILRFPDGSQTRIGYAGQNGQDYTGIGKLMCERKLITDNACSYQNITNYLRTHPGEASALMNENKSFVFFRELPDANIMGAMGVALTDRTSVAADPAYIPLGAPVFLSMDRAEANGLWIAQDTGGAIKGANRVDTYWGAGAEAQAISGGMASRGTMFVLLPRGTLAKLQSNVATPTQR